MTPAARVQAAIELLDAIVAAARDQGAAADTLIARYFATRRYAGSKDRRAVRELVYAAIRDIGERPANGRAAMLALADATAGLAACFDGSAHGPAPIMPDEARSVPGPAPVWLLNQLASSGLDGRELPALLDRAPLDLRRNMLKIGTVDLSSAIAVPGLPDALRLPFGTAIESTQAYRDGLVEVQDAGSQAVTLAARAEPGMQVIDLCAGAGGKTLALAAMMRDEGELLACDVDRGRLSRLPQRAARAGVSIASTLLLDPGREIEALADWRDRADMVMVDAPCSGTGTWRRNPEARWRLTPERLARLIESQTRLTEIAALLVRPGGALIYVVCSLLDAEGAGQVAAFQERHPDWRIDAPGIPFGRPHGGGVRLTPAHDGTDGFFVARLIRPC